jgi:hypothetical protein
MYSLVKIPVFAEKDIYSFSKAEAKEYYKWFVGIKNHRLQILEATVQEIYPNWKLDYERNSLIILYEWFGKRVSYRNMTDKEKIQVKEQISKTPLFVDVIDIPETTFSDETVSICFDIGIYFGETLINNIPGAEWIQKINSANFIDYAQPLIATKISKVPVNPRRSMEGIARRILDSDTSEIPFVEFFDKLVLRFSNELR